MTAQSLGSAERLEAEKNDLLAKAAQLAEQSHARFGDVPAADFLRIYYLHASAEDLVGRDPVDVYGAAMSHRKLADQRPQGTANVRIYTPTVEEHGWSSGHSVVEVVTDDMPFLLDSVVAEMSRQGRAIHLIIHPTLLVTRNVAGGLLAVREESPSVREPAGYRREAWLHIEIDRDTDSRRIREVSSRLQSVLRDVREAVEDWQKMRAAALRIADDLERSLAASRPGPMLGPPSQTSEKPPALPAAEVSEAPPSSPRGGRPGGSGVDAEPPSPVEADEVRELLVWLAEDHFTFLGYAEFRSSGAGPLSRPVPGSGLGILRDDQRLAAQAAVSPGLHGGPRRRLVITKAGSRSTVHRPAYMDCISVTTTDAATGDVVEHRFLGLFTSAAYADSVQRIPVLRQKAAQVLARSGLLARSHSGKDLLQVLETFPRDDLFAIPVDELEPVARAVLHLQERRRLRLFLRRDEDGHFLSCLVYLPRDRYTTAVRRKMEALLRQAFAVDTVDYTARVSESVLARLHFVVRIPPTRALPDVDAVELEERLSDATRSWADDFAEALVAQAGEEEAARLLRTYPDAFPEAYKEDFPARSAVPDLRRIDRLAEDGLAVSLYEPYTAGQGERRFKVYRHQPMSLSQVLPILRGLGADVVDERPYDLRRADGRISWIYDFGLRFDRTCEDPQRLKDLFQDAFIALWAGKADSDGFNALVPTAGLLWREVAVLRAYARYLRQAGSTFSQSYIEQCLVQNADIARMLVALFEEMLDPARTSTNSGMRAQRLAQDIVSALDDVASLDQDRILRSLLKVVRATVRTNYFQVREDGSLPEVLAVKLDPQRVPDLPAPRPRHEIWVSSPRVEGVHLRFGDVARGGLRWSDRPEDFRTEILGLVKAQTVKNAVIVPAGAKGGFVVRVPGPVPGAAGAAGPAPARQDVVDCYRAFVSALLDVTDNLVPGDGSVTVVPPRNVRRLDGDDAYLVVAADKGTATFSDIANEVAREHGFWLGDAFASGGSAGYDHKAMGITARGAWESVRRHFRELGIDVQSEDVTVAGIGDMSGDVFGNGLLSSPHLKLVAAFDHRHVFLDPDPDPKASFAERQRLFDLERSSWADYDPGLISEGGGVYGRDVKSIPVSAQVRQRLALDGDVTALTPAQLISGILQAPVDLLWNGGIGTYVKASAERNAEVGDKANDGIRVDGRQLRCRVVGEGGNLGFTQLGRVEAARTGVRLNTDAIDNSAGVDCSDHEVNLKILLDRIVADGDLTVKQRNELLTDMTEDVARLVLRDNYEQNVLLGNARSQAASMLPVHARFLADLERRGEINRSLEFLPGDREIAAREAAQEGLTSPELSVLVAYSKNTLAEELLASDLPDEEWAQQVLADYFPKVLVERFGDRLAGHPLRREIITTCVANNLVNRAGISFVFRAREETGAGAAEITRAFTVAREVFDFEQFWAAADALDNEVPTSVQSFLHLQSRRILDRTVRWLVNKRRGGIDVTADVARFRGEIDKLRPRLPELLCGVEAERVVERVGKLEADGVPPDLAAWSGAQLDMFALLDVIEVATATGVPSADVATLYFLLSESFEITTLLMHITALPRHDRWQSLARSALRYDVYAAVAALTGDVLTSSREGAPRTRLERWERRNAQGLDRAKATLSEIRSGGRYDLATLSVALRAIRALVSG